jgi:hypothetical protein
MREGREDQVDERPAERRRLKSISTEAKRKEKKRRNRAGFISRLSIG